MPRTINEYGKTVIRMTQEERGPLTDEERRMIREARNRLPVYDEDCPPIPEAMHRQIQMDIANRKDPNTGVDLGKYKGRGPKMFQEDAGDYIKRLRANDKM